jgi:hypothetical protein
MLPPGVAFKNLDNARVNEEGSLVIYVVLTDGRMATITLPEAECELRAAVDGEPTLQ